MRLPRGVYERNGILYVRFQDERGNIVNPGTGRISNGCIRTGDPAAIFAFAEVGMPVYVHS